ncbi:MULTISPECIES: deoxyguanosinetriphosphate triphosphohydrolase [unclassified Caulobacter]|uniref:deoxyguanosinetriphosphate triphosphohydrolase n=1 Tax=unclassified Caulobacter TaxID=2648921 RepID=UPI000D38F5CB|nr:MULTISPECIES: deoxyguanosinetriphosphate triphosphohydrolase [unclassified Caulobacter]PTS90167.1 deoxyguanosinetriphosphate triphosphohydrolase [Caulobacter sp. HMWF009]PTT08177.1 deoxyguanosinetriphosphate triphosphohydrolase [Caulobacter sp. HMWF025]
MTTSSFLVVRAPYAEDPSRSHGRHHKEDESRTRTPFARDRDRIIHNSAFRRLKEKTQVFVAHEGDNFRTRLTHSLEVAQVARSLATALGLDSDLAETIALGHDIGHPPFGHAGEDELQAKMAPYGGFDHNVQTFRVVTELEHRYPDFVGLNLTWETLEGIIKHNGPVTEKLGKPSWKAISKYDAEYNLGLDTWASAEAQVAALADDIAYNNHDVDDGVQAGLFTLDDLLDVPLIGPILFAVKSERPDLDVRLTRLEAVRRMIGAMVDDVMGETLHRAATTGVQSADEVRALDHALVAFSSDMAEDLARLRQFLHTRMYRHWKVNRTRSQARRILAEMFDLFLREPDVLPTVWFEKSQNRDEAGRARVVCDYIAGMTDRFAIEEHRKLFHLDIWN